jgi:ABC-type glycerol-3-phosphate transport system substrate-binding protein
MRHVDSLRGLAHGADPRERHGLSDLMSSDKLESIIDAGWERRGEITPDTKDELRDAVEQAKPRPVSPVYPQISEAIYTNVYAALQGDKSADQAAQDMNWDIQKALETF